MIAEGSLCGWKMQTIEEDRLNVDKRGRQGCQRTSRFLQASLEFKSMSRNILEKWRCGGCRDGEQEVRL